MHSSRPSKRTGAKTRVKQLLVLFTVSVALNYPWELAQAPLYAGMEGWAAIWWHCFVASLGDGILVWMIFAVGFAAFRRPDWYVRPDVRATALMLALGLCIGMGGEWAAVNVLGRWKYAPAMPLVPRLGIGLVPLLQMILLPPAIFHIATWWESKRYMACDT